MAIDLLNSFLQRGQSVSSNQTSAKAQVAQSVPANMQVMRAIQSMKAGQTIRGEVVSVNGENVQLAVLKDVIIDARLAQSMSLTQGMMMSFQVKSNNNQGLSLVPLFMNTAVDPNVIKALDMAGIGVNERSLEMVRALMERGMPIDKQSIQEMYRDVISFKDAAVNDIVSLHQMKLPVNQDNLTQLSLYQNNQHYLSESFSEIGNAIGKQLENLVSQGKTEEAVNLLQKLENFANSLKETSVNGESGNGTNDSSMTAGTEGNSSQVVKTAVFTEAMLSEESSQGEKGQKIQIELQGNEKLNETADSEKNVQNADKNVNSETMGKVQEETNPWKQLTALFQNEKNHGKISKLFEDIWDKNVGKQWLLEKETIQDKEKVVGYFEKLTRQVKQLENILESAAGEKSAAAKAVHNTASNLDFMNQLNQMHAYIQLPLKMANRDAHGELYVFTNKKTLTRKDGKVSALLHLDMEYLGNMDIYVAMEDKKVSTNFYLEKEEYLEFLEGHMDMLTARLNKRGYSCDVKTSLRNSDEKESVIKTIEKEQGSPMLLSMQAFDMRA